MNLPRPGRHLNRTAPLLALLAVVCALGSSGQAEAAGALDTLIVASPDEALFPSLALDSDNNPVLAYYEDLGHALKVLRCNDQNCAGNDESLTAPVSAGGGWAYVSLELDGNDFPVISYTDGTSYPGTLTVLHCNDLNCAGGDESVAPQSAFGWFTSLDLDGNGYPVVSFFDVYGSDLSVLHCDDPNCSGGGESITSPDTVGYVGEASSLALDVAGNPVVSYWDRGDMEIHILHCDDPNCSFGGESIATADSGSTFVDSTALALDSSGNPVVAYPGGFLHCNDPACAGGDDVATPLEVGPWISMAIDPAGNPAILSRQTDLTLLRCNDPNCAGADEASALLAWISYCSPCPNMGTALAVDALGNIAVAYRRLDTKPVIIRCATPLCDADTDGDGCRDIREQDNNVLAGGFRNPKNPHDYFNPSHDGKNRVDDILLVVNQYFKDDSDGNPGLPPYAPGYSPDTDRTLVGPLAWNLGPPNGLQRIDDILNIVKQYFHDCA